MNLGKRGLNGMIVTVLTIVIVISAVTILWGFLSRMLSGYNTESDSAIAGFLKSLSPRERDIVPGDKPNNIIPLNGACLIYNCNDTDSLIDFQDNEKYIPGKVTLFNETFSFSYSDNCTDNSTLIEYYYTNDSVIESQINCGEESLCSDGACANQNPVYYCYDSDNSNFEFQDYEKYILSNVTLFNETINRTWRDSCDGVNNVTEYYCEDINNGFEISVECGANSTCNDNTGACTCGNLGEACCPIQKGYVCSGNLECKDNVCVNVVPSSNCGNGIIESGEQCDNGTLLNGQVCTPAPSYGGSCTYCFSSCSLRTVLGPRCGDVITQNQYEECDDGNNINNDFCKNDCQEPYCGDGVCSYLEDGWCSDCYVPPPIVCFLGDTKISTPSGDKEIKDIKEGDIVLSYNEETEKIEGSKVTMTFKHQATSYLIVNDRVKVTPNHPMHINGEWKEIGKAKVGDKLKTSSGEEIINSIEIVSEDVPVYNLEVDKNHNYYAEDYLAHNKADSDCPDPPCIH